MCVCMRLRPGEDIHQCRVEVYKNWMQKLHILKKIIIKMLLMSFLFTITARAIYYLCRFLSPSLLLSPSLTSRVKSAVSARSSVHSQGVLRAGSFLKTLLMDWPDIPSKWSTLSVNSLSDKDPLLFTFPFYKSSP